MRPRRLLAGLLGVALLVSACGTASQGSAAPSEGAVATGEDNAAPSGAALLLTQRRGDKGVVDALVAGFESGTERLGYQDAQIVQLEDPATYEQTVRQVAGSGVSIVIATFPPMIDSIKAVAPEFPDVNFVIIDARIGEELPNVQELFFYENESSYLAGIAAGMMTEADQVAFIGGDDVDVINRYLVGFYEGAHASNENVTVCWAYAKSFEDPAKGREVALSVIEDGADVIHAATAGTQLGIYEAVEETGTWMISADVDVRELAPTAGLFATGPRFDQAVEIVLEQNANGEFRSGFQQYGMQSGLVGATPFSEHVPEDVKTAVEEAAEAIAAGEVTVSDDTKLAEYSNCS